MPNAVYVTAIAGESRANKQRLHYPLLLNVLKRRKCHDFKIVYL